MLEKYFENVNGFLERTKNKKRLPSLSQQKKQLSFLKQLPRLFRIGGEDVTTSSEGRKKSRLLKKTNNKSFLSISG